MHAHAHRRHTPTQHASAVARKQAHRRSPAVADPTFHQDMHTCMQPGMPICIRAYKNTRTLASAQDRPHMHARIRQRAYAYSRIGTDPRMLPAAHGLEAARAVVAPITTLAHERMPPSTPERMRVSTCIRAHTHRHTLAYANGPTHSLVHAKRHTHARAYASIHARISISKHSTCAPPGGRVCMRTLTADTRPHNTHPR